jgi:hypothetical protein
VTIARTSRFAAFRKSIVQKLALILLSELVAFSAAAQYTPPPPPPPPSTSQSASPAPAPGPTFSEQQLDRLVAPIALYPDPLLAQVLTAATYWNEIPDAAAWANQHSYLKGDALADAIRADNVDWDPSVIALLPFPSVLNMMAQDLTWTQQLGEAVLTQRSAVMDAVQRMRTRAFKYGYLRSNPYCSVIYTGGYVEILPVNPAYIYVPTYDPLVVFEPPRPGIVVGAAIHFGPAVVIGAGFAPWGWANVHFLWGGHAIIFDDTPWDRTWLNRRFYVHPYAHPWIRAVGPRVERHPLGRR